MLTRKIFLAAALAIISVGAVAAQTPSPNYSDQQFLASDSTFQNRVRQALVAGCISLNSESITQSTFQFHMKRANVCASILLSGPDAYKIVFAQMVSTDTNVINDATVNGTVSLNSGNVATQAALVTDPHLNTALISQFNTALSLP